MALPPAPAPAPANRAVRLVPVVTVVCVLLVAGGVSSFVVRGAPLQEVFDAWVLQNAPVGLVSIVVFGLALRRQPGNRAAWFFFAAGVFASIHVAAMGLAHAAAASERTAWQAALEGTIALREVPGSVMWPYWTAASIWLLAAGLPLTLGLLYFPDGRLPSARWRPVPWLAGTGVGLSTAAFAWGNRPWSNNLIVLDSVPFDDPVARTLFLVGMPLLGAVVLLTAASLVVRMRHAAESERRRVRPVVIAGTLVAAVMVLLYPWPALWAVATVPTVALLLVSIAASVTRHHLFDVEVVVSRAVAVFVLGASVTLTYVGIVAGLGALFGTDAALGRSVAATAVIAVGFEPLRRRVVAATTRMVLGTRTTPYEVLSALSDRLARADSTAEVLERVVDLLVEGTGATRAEVRSLSGGAGHLDAAAGERPDGPETAVRSAPVANAGELLGEVRLLAPREDRFTPADERLLHQVAATLGPVLSNANLTGELQRHIEELRASRERLVAAHDDARRGLERDIHDGAQQQLLALRIKLGLAATLAEQQGDARVAGVIDGVAADADAAIRQLRDLARGLYPPVLAEQGLEAALRSQARSLPLPVTFEAEGLRRHDRGVESTVYFCCLEAMQNAARHAGASQLRIELGDAGHGPGTVLRFAVIDDGVGFDPAVAAGGSGLANMADRIQGRGGGLEIDSAPGRGTALRGWVPATDAGSGAALGEVDEDGPDPAVDLGVLG